MTYLKSKVGKSACLPVVSWVVTVACRGHTQGSHRPPPLFPLALSALYPGRSAAEAGSFLFRVYILGDLLVVVYFCEAKVICHISKREIVGV